MEYRPEIDGLRGISVILVVLFHASVSLIPGGFIGVDVFFVISGYLITGIVLQGLEQNKFTFAGFYERRIRRIIPALLTVVFAVLAFGPFFLLPGDLVAAANSALYAIGSLSNFFFLYNTGYFDAAAESMPLLHTWSLGVEEQFYLVWPAALIALYKLFAGNRRVLAFICGCMALGSFAGSIVLLHFEPKAAFFLPQARAWELGCGALLAAWPSEWHGGKHLVNGTGMLGLVLIFLSAGMLTRQSPFPGINALYPALGAMLLLIPWQRESWPKRLLSRPPLVHVGKISYSLYLWHWPILVFYRHYDLGTSPSPVAAVVLLAGASVLAWLSWRFIEQPARRMALSSWSVICVGAVAMAIVAAPGALVVAAAGLPQRIPAKERGLESLEVMWQWDDCRQKRPIPGLSPGACIVGADWDTAQVHGVLWGDSNMLHFAPLLDEAARKVGIALIEWPGCVPLIGDDGLKISPSSALAGYPEFCFATRRLVLRFIRGSKDIKLLTLAAAWSYAAPHVYRDDPAEIVVDRSSATQHGNDLMNLAFGQLQSAIGRLDVNFLVLSQVASRAVSDVGCLYAAGTILLRRPCPDTTATLRSSHPGMWSTTEMIRSLPNRYESFFVVVPSKYMCGADSCMTSLDGEFLYRDAVHLRRNLTPATRTKLVQLLGLQEALERASGLGLGKNDGDLR